MFAGVDLDDLFVKRAGLKVFLFAGPNVPDFRGKLQEAISAKASAEDAWRSAFDAIQLPPRPELSTFASRLQAFAREQAEQEVMVCVLLYDLTPSLCRRQPWSSPHNFTERQEIG